MDSPNYRKRLEYCQHKVACHNADSGEWLQAVEVYWHLINCNKSHTMKDNGNSFCTWSANGVEK